MTPSAFRIVEDFLSVQGEGFHSGTFARFVRLAGCNSPALGLDCAEWCDTNYEDPKWAVNVSAFNNWFEHQSFTPLLIFTGGEPLLYQNLIREWLITSSLSITRVCIETNGTIPRTLDTMKDVWYTVSPKGPEWNLGTGPISEVKLVITPIMLLNLQLTLDLMDTMRGNWYHFLQPLDNDLQTAKDIVEQIIARRPSWRLSLQTHKLISML